MDASEWIALAAVAIAVVFGLVNAKQAADSAASAKRSADSADGSLKLAQEQLEHALAVQRDSTQPYVWADLRPRDDGQIMDFVLGNSGPTVATDIHVSFDTPLDYVVPDAEVKDAQHVQELLRSGVKSLAPGRSVSWSLGATWAFFEPEMDSRPKCFKMAVTATGPFGEVPTVEIAVSLDDQKHQSARALGVALLEQPLKKVESHLGEIKKALVKP